MIIAVSSESKDGLEANTAHHFGRCPYYTLVTIGDDSKMEAESIVNPFFQQHIPGKVPDFIRSLGVDVMIAGGMGQRAIAIFERHGIQVVTGASGTVRQVVERYLAGDLTGTQPCREHGPD